MRILVYGAGVIGCELAHELYKGGNNVTLFARGDWKQTIDKKGLKIFHYGQLHTTVDYIKTIDRLDKDDVYDFIFVVMRYNQTLSILPVLAENRTEKIILVGNNANPEECQRLLSKGCKLKREVAFGFIGLGGTRKKDKVISMHFKPELTIGGLRTPVSDSFKCRLVSAFSKTKCTLTWESHMEGWLLSHVAHVLPTCYLCYDNGFNLKHADRKEIDQAVEANIEAYQLLKNLGYPIRPSSDETEYLENPVKKQRWLYIMAKTPIGKFVISNHCKNAIDEMHALDHGFEVLRKRVESSMTAWDDLRNSALPVLDSCRN